MKMNSMKPRLKRSKKKKVRASKIDLFKSTASKDGTFGKTLFLGAVF